MSVKLSKFLSLILRHKPEVIGLALDRCGWASIKELITKSNQYGKQLTRDLLDEIVATNNKQRFKISDDGKKIRASQGHSFEVDLELDPIEPPASLYHGTATRFLDSIMKEGLKSKNRQHVHLSADFDTAIVVGKRHGKAIVLKIDTEAMYKKGFKFYLSDNGVWLTDLVPSEYLIIIGSTDE